MKKKIIFLILMYSVVLLITLQTTMQIFPKAVLIGAEAKIEMPNFSFRNFFGTTYQAKLEKYLSANIGFRGRWIRVENQINYSIFNEISSTYESKIVLGRENYLYESVYISSYNNLDAVTPQDIEKQVRQLAILEKMLKKRGITFLFIITPSKAITYPEYIPEKYIIKHLRSKKSNYANLIPLLEKYNVSYLDGHKFVSDLRKHSIYPLFCKGGTHWSILTEFQFLQKIVANLGIRSKKNLITFDRTSILRTVKPKYPDDDIALLTNIPFKKELYDQWYYYPIIKTDGHVATKYRPKVIHIGGSFLKNIQKHMDTYSWYKERDFYYYYNTNQQFPNKTITPVIKDARIIAKKILGSDIIIIETNESVLANIGFGFIDDAINSLKIYGENQSSVNKSRIN